MDTGTHFVMGVGLAGLAQIDPIVASSPAMGGAVMLATIIGSQAPDLDTLYRLRGNSLYVRNHRGASHSIPALLLYAMIIPIVISFLFVDIDIFHLFLWTGIALGIHVLTDLLNGYGTQAFRPFTDAWVSWNVLHIFDVVIFTLHVIGIALWFLGVPPSILFASIYVLLILYTLSRIGYKSKIKDNVLSSLSEPGELHLFPTRNLFEWNLIFYGKEKIRLGEVKKGEISWSESLPLLQSSHPAIEHAKQHRDIQNFLYFSRYAYIEMYETDFGYEVRFIDLRYRKKRNFPLLAAIYLNQKLEPIDCYVGWKQEQKVSKKLRLSL